MVTNHSAPSQKQFKVLIVDDHPVVRDGLAMRIGRQSNTVACSEAADGVEALRLITATNPDIAVIDIALKSGNGIDLIKRIRARNYLVRLLVCSMHNESLYAERALRAGANGYINKEQAASKIIEAITHVLNGKVYLSEEASDRLLNRAIGAANAHTIELPSVETLSDRELEVFQLYGQGFNTHQVAQHLSISSKTIETYRSRIKAKLDLKHVSELVCRATQWVLENRQ